jgi:hypothetical protein
MKYLTLLLAMALLATAALARDDGRKLVIGSLYRVVRNLIEVQEDGGGKSVIKVDAATTYTNSSTEKPAKLKDLSVGDPVVVKVVSKDGIDTAAEVKFVPATPDQKPKSNR